MTRPPDPGSAPPTRPEKVGLALLAVLVVAFGGLVVKRSTTDGDRKTDFGVYARAAHAVRVGQDIYAPETADDHYWHYCYPPPLAILLVPLADPFQYEYREGFGPFRRADHVRPDGTREPGGWYLRYEVSVALWYLVSVALLAYTVHTLAKAVLPSAVPYSRRWWSARVAPVLVCAAGVGYTLSRGQVNILLLALVAGMFAAAVRGRTVASGAWLAGAVALKVIPAFLILWPFARFLQPGGRREWRVWVGLVAGLAVLLGALPAALWGVGGAWRSNLEMVDAVIAPGAAGVGDQTRARELTNVTATDSQSFQAVLHILQYPDPHARPTQPDPLTRLAHWAIGGAMTLATVLVGWRRAGPRPADRLVLLGCFCVVMLLITPISHMHYYAMALPLVAGLWLRDLADRPGRVWARPGVAAALAAWGVVVGVILLPYGPVVQAREAGLGTLATAALWAFGVAALARRPRAAAAAPAGAPVREAALAA